MSQSNAAIADLSSLLKGMKPVLTPEVYVFATVSPDVADALPAKPIMRFEEGEGTTLLLLESDAESAGIEHEFACQKITLHVHSALEAVGFMAAISNKLKEVGVPANVVAGYYHDHLFIPLDKVETALAALKELAAG